MKPKEGEVWFVDGVGLCWVIRENDGLKMIDAYGTPISMVNGKKVEELEHPKDAKAVYIRHDIPIDVSQFTMKQMERTKQELEELEKCVIALQNQMEIELKWLTEKCERLEVELSKGIIR